MPTHFLVDLSIVAVLGAFAVAGAHALILAVRRRRARRGPPCPF